MPRFSDDRAASALFGASGNDDTALLAGDQDLVAGLKTQAAEPAALQHDLRVGAVAAGMPPGRGYGFAVNFQATGLGFGHGCVFLRQT